MEGKRQAQLSSPGGGVFPPALPCNVLAPFPPAMQSDKLCETLSRRQVPPLADIRILTFSFLSMRFLRKLQLLEIHCFSTLKAKGRGMAISFSLKYISQWLTDPLSPVPKSGVFLQPSLTSVNILKDVRRISNPMSTLKQRILSLKSKTSQS